MTYESFEHEADIGIRGKGKSMEIAFEEAAKAMFNVEVDVEKVKPLKQVKVAVEADNIEELLIEWLNALLSQASLQAMVFSRFKVKIINSRNIKFKLQGSAKGEKLEPKRHNVKDEVKGATYSQLKVYQSKGLWIAQCIVDV